MPEVYQNKQSPEEREFPVLLIHSPAEKKTKKIALKRAKQKKQKNKKQKKHPPKNTKTQKKIALRRVIKPLASKKVQFSFPSRGE